MPEIFSFDPKFHPDSFQEGVEAQNLSGFDVEQEIEKVAKKMNGQNSDSGSHGSESLHRIDAFEEDDANVQVAPADIVLEDVNQESESWTV